MKTIVFIKDFATKLKGETWNCDSMLANQLVHVDKVAEYYDQEKEVKTQIKKEKKK